MIYICIPARDEARTVGLVLWKVRKVFEEFGREYQILLAEDGSADDTADVLDPYAKVLPLTLVRHPIPLGYAASIVGLLRTALERSDRPRRDCAVLMHADFSHGPEHVPDLIRQMDSGADLVVGEGRVAGRVSSATRLLRRLAPLMLRSAVRLPGVRDVVSGFLAVRLSCLRLALRGASAQFLDTDGWAANAELLARLGRQARRVETVPVTERYDRRRRSSRVSPWVRGRAVWEARALVRAAGASA